MIQELGLLPPMWEAQMEFLASAFGGPSFGCYGYLGSEPMDGRLSVTLLFKQLNLLKCF